MKKRMKNGMSHYEQSHSRTRRPGTPASRGMASIIVTMITMIVISLIVLGFATVSRREQREQLDSQLSTQAFYAAESAVEDARNVIQQALKNGQPLVGKDDCLTNNPGGNYPTGIGTVLDGSNEVSYTCLKVDVTPDSTQYGGVDDDYIVVPIKTAQPVDHLEITWQPTVAPAGTPAACPGSTNKVFSPQDKWSCGYGMMRMDMLKSGGAVTSAGLQSGMLTGYFVPTSNAASGVLSYNNSKGAPNVVAANCGTAAYTVCKASITDLGTDTDFRLRISSLYRTSNVTVAAFQGSSPVTISGAQAVIDATGRAQDVLRRIQVRLPVSTATKGVAPGFALQSNGSICKRFQVSTTYFNIPGDIVNKDGSNPLCVQKSDGVPPPVTCTENNDIALAVDVSNTMDHKWQNNKAIDVVRNAVINFANGANIADTKNHAALVEWSYTNKHLYPLGGDQGSFVAAANQLSTSTGTYYMQGVGEADKELTGPNARAGSPKVLIFITDGYNDDSETTIRTKVAAMQSLGYKIYTIGIDGTTYNSPVSRFNEPLLVDMAGNGGRFAAATTEQEFANLMLGISNDLRCP